MDIVKLNQYGQEVANQSSIFDSVMRFMENPETRSIYNKDFSSFIFYLWIYRRIEQEAQRCHVNLSGQEKLALMHQCLRTSSIRQRLIRAYRTIQSGEDSGLGLES